MTLTWTDRAMKLDFGLTTTVKWIKSMQNHIILPKAVSTNIIKTLLLSNNIMYV